MANIGDIMSKISALLEKYPDFYKNAIYLNKLGLLEYLAPNCGRRAKYLEFVIKNYKDIYDDPAMNMAANDLAHGDCDDYVVSNASQEWKKYSIVCLNGLENIKKFFVDFEKYSSKLSKKDIYQYSFKELKSELEKCGPSISDIKKQGAKIIFENDEFIAIHPLTYEANKLYSANTKWCTSSNETIFKDYNSIRATSSSLNYNFLFFIIDKINGKKYALHLGCVISSNNINNILQNKNNIKINHNYSIYDEKDSLIMCEYDNDELKKQVNATFNNLLVGMPASFNIIINKYNEHIVNYYLDVIKKSFKINEFDNYSLLLKNKNNYFKFIYKNNNSNIADDFNNHLKTEKFTDDTYLNVILYAHESECAISKLVLKNKKEPKAKPVANSNAIIKKTNSIKENKDIKNINFKIDMLSKHLAKCSCSKFIEYNFLSKLIDRLNIDKNNKVIIGDYTSIIKVLKTKLDITKISYLSKKELIPLLLTTNDINLGLLSNVSFTKEELLFLQCHSKNKNLQKFCRSKTSAPDDLAKEFLILKNINSIDDLLNFIKNL